MQSPAMGVALSTLPRPKTRCSTSSPGWYWTACFFGAAFCMPTSVDVPAPAGAAGAPLWRLARLP